MTSPAPSPILPPRPNLGPEPWPVQDWSMLALTLAGIAIAIVGCAGWLLLRAARRRRVSTQVHPPFASPDDGTSSDSLIPRAERIRAALAERFGPAWTAKTTEEIALAPELRTWLDHHETDRLVSFLAAADRAKFASPALSNGQGAELFEWADSFLARVTAAEVTSAIKGR